MRYIRLIGQQRGIVGDHRGERGARRSSLMSWACVARTSRSSLAKEGEWRALRGTAAGAGLAGGAGCVCAAATTAANRNGAAMKARDEERRRVGMVVPLDRSEDLCASAGTTNEGAIG